MSRAHGLPWIKLSIQSGFAHGLSLFAATVLTRPARMVCRGFLRSNVQGLLRLTLLVYGTITDVENENKGLWLTGWKAFSSPRIRVRLQWIWN